MGKQQFMKMDGHLQDNLEMAFSRGGGQFNMMTGMNKNFCLKKGMDKLNLLKNGKSNYLKKK